MESFANYLRKGLIGMISRSVAKGKARYQMAHLHKKVSMHR